MNYQDQNMFLKYVLNLMPSFLPSPNPILPIYGHQNGSSKADLITQFRRGYRGLQMFGFLLMTLTLHNLFTVPQAQSLPLPLSRAPVTLGNLFFSIYCMQFHNTDGKTYFFPFFNCSSSNVSYSLNRTSFFYAEALSLSSSFPELLYLPFLEQI